jgi:hypothetical protein
MGKHHPLSPSSMRRAVNCPASVGRSEGLQQETSSYAEEGTAAHEVLDLCLLSGIKAKDATENAEMVAAIDMAVDFIDSLPAPVLEGVEDYIPPDPEVPDLGGTVDYFRVYDSTLHIVDYKHGAGVNISPQGNEQMLSYGILIRRKYRLNLDHVNLTIIQPRAPGDPVQTWETTPDALNDFEAVIRQIQNDPHRAKCGDWCRWCPARDVCPELHVETLKAAQAEFANMSPKQLAELWLLSDAIKAKLAAIPTRLLDEMKLGKTFKGIKAVRTFGNRTWRDGDAEILAELKKVKVPKTKATVAKLLTPPQLEKLLGSDERFRHLVHKQDKGYAIAKDSDRRQAVDLGVSEFTAIVEKKQ